MGRWLKIGAVVCLFAFFALLFAEKIDLSRDDIGRHLVNGRVTLAHFMPPETNLYSYTQPDRGAVNHHWASGVVFYAVWKYAGFDGLSVFHVLLRTTALVLVFLWARRKTGTPIALLLTFAALPIIIRRREVRPEAFTYIGIGIMLWIADWYKRTNRIVPAAVVAGVTQVLWVNLHSQFVFGPMVIAAYAVTAAVKKKPVKGWMSLLLVSVAASLLNPRGLRGVLYPLFIIAESAISVGENQPLLLMARMFRGPEYLYTEFLAAALLVLFAAALVRSRFRPGAWFGPALVGLASGIAAFLAIRNMVLFAYVFVAAASSCIRRLTKGISPGRAMMVSRYAWIAVAAVVTVGLPLVVFSLRPFTGQWGVGLLPGVNNAADFMKKERIRGPIFNNFDIGAYLIFHFYPDEKVFTDNRAEAYSREFWTQLYGPMLRSADAWNKADDYYHFNAVVVSPYGLSVPDMLFIRRLEHDPAWALVYLDSYAAVFVRRDGVNAPVSAHELIGKTVYDD